MKLYRNAEEKLTKIDYPWSNQIYLLQSSEYDVIRLRPQLNQKPGWRPSGHHDIAEPGRRTQAGK
jgi:hypothetical protein